MKKVSFVLYLILTSIFFNGYSQTITKETGFKWKNFSFYQNWKQIKYSLKLDWNLTGTFPDIIYSFPNNYELNESQSFYKLKNLNYDTIFSTGFNISFFHLDRNIKNNELLFIKQISENDEEDFLNNTSNDFNKLYNNILKISGSENLFYKTEDSIKWIKNGISIKLEKYKSLINVKEGIIILTITPRDSYLYSYLHKDIFFDSQYEERFTQEFKEFDSSNGYKLLKFGTPKFNLTDKYKLIETNQNRTYKIEKKQFSSWGGILFDEFNIFFNKKDLLTGVILLKESISEDDFDSFINVITKLLGSPSSNTVDKDIKYFIYTGKKINIIISRSISNKIFSVEIYNSKLDDSKESDILY